VNYVYKFKESLSRLTLSVYSFVITILFSSRYSDDDSMDYCAGVPGVMCSYRSGMGGGYSIIYWRTREPFPGPFDKLGKIITKKFKILPNGHM